MILLPLVTPQILLFIFIRHYTPIFAIYTLNKCFYCLYLLPKFILFIYIRLYTPIFAFYFFYKCFYYLYLLPKSILFTYIRHYTSYLPDIPSINSSITSIYFPNPSYLPIYAIIHPYLHIYLL